MIIIVCSHEDGITEVFTNIEEVIFSDENFDFYLVKNGQKLGFNYPYYILEMRG